jgi:arylsulfatase A
MYYTIAHAHGPQVPTPDSAVRVSKKAKRDTKHFADMVTYTDKIVGKILDKLDAAGLSENTLVLFVGDNGTDKKVTSLLGERQIKGGKGGTRDAGTHVPLLAYWQGVTPVGRICDDLIDFSDFAPTLVQMSQTTVPTGLAFDGISFLPQLTGKQGHPKEYIFCHYDKGKHPIEGQTSKQAEKRKAKTGRQDRASYTRWVRDKRWKLYDNGKLFDVVGDPDEQQPIQAGVNPVADYIRKQFQAVLDDMK